MEGGQQPWLFVGLIACLYCLMGGLRLVPVLLGLYCFLTAWTPVLVYRITRQLGAPTEGARIAGWLTAVSPAFAFWSAQVAMPPSEMK